jgi:exonuclease 3'-5' domain-containing protein 1
MAEARKPQMGADAANTALGSMSLGGEAAPLEYRLIDTVTGCAESLGALIAVGAPVAVDYEGVNLCRDGVLCLVQVAPRRGPVLLIDIETLGDHAFGDGRLRELLESENIVKICYDCRSDADALHHLHGTTPTKLWDVQVAYCSKRDRESRRGRDPFVKGLSKAIEDCPGLTANDKIKLQALKATGTKLFDPKKGGSYEVWQSRPMDPVLQTYAAADVRYLHAMRDAWGKYVTRDMFSITARRVQKAVQGVSAARGRHMAKKDF